MEHWGWLVVIYLFMGGLGAGAYATAFAAERGWLGPAKGIDKAGYYIAAPIVAVGCALLVFDLGQGLTKPWLIVGMMVNYTSVMTWGVYILTIFLVAGFIKSYFIWKQAAAPAVLDYIGLFAALAVGAYTGMLLVAVKAVPFWNSYLIPLLFIVSALSTGLAIATLFSRCFTLKEEQHSGANVDQVHTCLIVLEFVLLAAFMGNLLSGYKGAAALLSAGKLLSGSLSIPFWGFFVGLGLLLPLAVFAHNTFRENKLSGSCVACSKAGVLAGGLALRYLLIFAAQPVWTGTL